MARLEHPHIVPLYDYWREPDDAYLVMRWLRAGSLHDALQRGPWHVVTAVRRIDQIAAALLDRPLYQPLPTAERLVKLISNAPCLAL